MKKYWHLIRVNHYVKNFLIFLPLFFSKNIINSHYLINTIIGFLVFCLMASFIYIINDVKDLEKDRLHPIKKNRPLAYSAISRKRAIIIGVFMFILAVILIIYFLPHNYELWLVLGLYIISNLGYSIGLKKIPLLDIMILTLGFIIRLFFGALISNIQVSNWLYLTVMSMAFYISLGKRKTELSQSGLKSRDVLKYYNPIFLDKFISICISLTITFYSLWCINQDYHLSRYLVWTIPLILLICMKYSLTMEHTNNDPVDILLKDKILLILLGLYLIVITIIIYI